MSYQPVLVYYGLSMSWHSVTLPFLFILCYLSNTLPFKNPDYINTKKRNTNTNLILKYTHGSIKKIRCL